MGGSSPGPTVVVVVATGAAVVVVDGSWNGVAAPAAA
jgi:hypothetical protein